MRYRLRDLSFVINIASMARLKNYDWFLGCWCAVLFMIGAVCAEVGATESLINFAPLDRAVARFNAMENEPVINLVSNAEAGAWLRTAIPLFECPDAAVEEIYYFRWWAFRKHLRRGPDTGERYVFTEFITRPKPVSSGLGHHLAEGRWLRDSKYLDDTVLYWMRGGPAGRSQTHLHKYSQWLAHAVYARSCVTGDERFAVGLLDDLVADYQNWTQEKQRPDGLFWQYDVWDAMEESISGSRTKKNIRPTINSYMFGNAQAIAAIARWAGRNDLATEFTEKAERLQKLTVATLWDAKAQFFKVRYEDGSFSDAREAIGFIPWYFGLPRPQKGYEAAWAQLIDPQGFHGAMGLTTAERRHAGFRTHGTGKCEWDGPVWPFATSQTLVALGNVLRDYPTDVIARRDYFEAFQTYVRSHRYDGLPYIGEYHDETTGAWLKGRDERSRYYNHSTFADLVITGVVGLRPRSDDWVEVHPLLPEGQWNWFKLDRVRYHGRELTILWDADGKHFGRGVGLQVLADGKLIARADRLGLIKGQLP